jgi:hypothetical protein
MANYDNLSPVFIGNLRGINLNFGIKAKSSRSEVLIISRGPLQQEVYQDNKSIPPEKGGMLSLFSIQKAADRTGTPRTSARFAIEGACGQYNQGHSVVKGALAACYSLRAR